MASSVPNRALVARAAAVLTTGEVAATRLDLNEAWGGKVCVELSFTLGMLTNCVLRHYASMDGSTWVPVYLGTVSTTETITATATRALNTFELGGWKYYRATIQGTGTVTNSSATITYRYLRRGSQ